MPSNGTYWADLMDGDVAPVAARSYQQPPKPRRANEELFERHGNTYSPAKDDNGETVKTQHSREPGMPMIDVYGEMVELGKSRDGSPVYARWGHRASHDYVSKEYILYDMNAGMWYIYPGGDAAKEADILARDPFAKLAERR